MRQDMIVVFEKQKNKFTYFLTCAYNRLIFMLQREEILKRKSEYQPFKLVLFSHEFRMITCSSRLG